MKKLSEFEQSVLQLFWDHEVLSAPQVHQRLADERDVSYSTVKTIIDRLEKKQALVRDGLQGRTIFYRASIDQQQASKPLFKGLLDRLFGGSPRDMLAHLIREEKLSDDDIRYIQSILKEKQNEQ